VLRRLTASVAAIAFRVFSVFMSSPSGRVAITLKDPGHAVFLPAVTPVTSKLEACNRVDPILIAVGKGRL
jgi:hypothetical protein